MSSDDGRPAGTRRINVLHTPVLCLVSLLMLWKPASADAEPVRGLYLQAGVAEDSHSLTAGISRDWNWKTDTRYGPLAAQWQAEVAWWRSDLRSHTQIGITPTLRLYPTTWSGRWFVEGGIGINAITPLYQATGKRFSTTLNFGEHLALGRRWGLDGRHEWSLRLQHFSNASIKKPNPGENFLQVRYTQRLSNI
jgi:lipid A 3-O-deacylase